MGTDPNGFCYGTTHADCFYGHVPITRLLSEDEVSSDYEGNTGKAIVERFQGIDPLSVPGVLVAGHAPFVWGATVAKAVDNAISLEAIARMARLTEEVRAHGASQQLPQHVLDKHFLRKHGANAYYGQSCESCPKTHTTSHPSNLPHAKSAKEFCKEKLRGLRELGVRNIPNPANLVSKLHREDNSALSDV